MPTPDEVQRIAIILHKHDPANIASAGCPVAAYYDCATELYKLMEQNIALPVAVESALVATFKHRYLFSRYLVTELKAV